MAGRSSLAAALLLVVAAGCGEDSEPARQVRLLAPVGLVGEVEPFERQSGCRVDLRVYDEGENIAAIAKRRDADVVAVPVRAGRPAHDSVELVRIELESGLEVTIPKALASAFDGSARPAGQRRTAWTFRTDGENPDCARAWLAYATSQ